MVPNAFYRLHLQVAVVVYATFCHHKQKHYLEIRVIVFEYLKAELPALLVLAQTFADEDALPSPEYEPVYPVRYREQPPHPAIQIVKVGGILANAAVKTGVGLSVITLQQCGLLAKITTTLIVDDAKRIASGLFKCIVGRLSGLD
jgi:hypothetical protein